ncbi:MAG: energy transducer TonB [Proteobacteria bacterium]|jgi:protein TonB|nr:energy transducer TonB [Pseudomonadota bacterium]MDA1300747.1 energy transducer TonB [Pseudomonadota bacterium]
MAAVLPARQRPRNRASVTSAAAAVAVRPAVSAMDRLTFTLFLAVVLHGVIILGVTFTQELNRPSTHTMEVTLAQHRSDNRPDKADFLAQFNQTGSGTLDEKKLTTTTNLSEFHDNEIRETLPVPVSRPSKRVERAEHPVVTTTSQATQAATDHTKYVVPEPTEGEDTGRKSLLERSLEIASLEARLDQQRQIYAKRPRIKRLTSLSTASSIDAYYLNSWRRKIETIGNLNYPSEARRQGLYGCLRLMVAILPDGALKDIEITASSGHQILDDAAVRIVKLASPFAPFPDELRQTTDVLEIIRTWQFRRNSVRSSLSC